MIFPIQISLFGQFLVGDGYLPAVDTYLRSMVFIAPAICSFMCGLLVLVVLLDTKGHFDKRTTIISAASLLCVGILWLRPGLSWGLGRFSGTLSDGSLYSGTLSSGAISGTLSDGLSGALSVQGHVFWIGLCAFIVSCVEVMLTYNILRPVATKNGGGEKIIPQETGGGLTRKTLEDYFRQEKPYLDSEFKLEQLAAATGATRSEMSAFINRSFGMNFKRYVNRWRLAEYDRLMSLPSNEPKNPYKMMPMAGFTDPRHYKRALETERSEQVDGKHRQTQ